MTSERTVSDASEQDGAKAAAAPDQRISLAARLFPERRVFSQTGDSVAFSIWRPGAQAAVAFLLALLVGWSAYATYHVIADSAPLPRVSAYSVSPDHAVERAQARLEEYERLYDEMAAQLAVKSAQTQEVALERAALAARLETLEAQTQEVEDARRDVAARLHGAAGQTAELSELLTRSEAEERRVRAMLTAVSGRLAVTASERDQAARALHDSRLELADTRADLELTRIRAEQVLSRLESAARASMSELEVALSRAGVDVEGLLAEIAAAYSGAGGPFSPIGGARHSAVPVSFDRADDIITNLERVNMLRLAVDGLPLAHPVRAAHRRSSRFGYRRHPVTRRRDLHKGLDLAAPRGTPTFATAPGRVTYAGRMGGYGKVVRINHGFGFQTTYAHLSRIRVSVGEEVARGDQIGDIGSTGRSTGPHLHYEVRRHGRPIDPAKFIEAGRHVF